VTAEFISVVSDIARSGSPSRKVSYDLLRSLKEMTRLVGRDLKSLRVSRNGDGVVFGPDLGRSLDRILAPEETYAGSLRGMLDAINVHGGINLFHIYPDVGPHKVACHFRQDLQTVAVEGLGRYVQVSGTLKYKVSSPYPHEIQVEHLEILPNEADLPTLYELKGVAPDATGELSSVEFVRKLRNATA
jgi:hypothetical protein